MATQEELVRKAQRGERITKAEAEYSMFEAPLDKCPMPYHSWRVIVCASAIDEDVSECRGCGKQITHGCTFDEECS